MEDEKKLKELIDKLFGSYRNANKYDEVKVVNSWEQIAGKIIAQKTSKIYINKQTLNLTITSPALKNELRFHKLVLIEKVNTFAGKQIIKDINFYG